MAAQAWKRLVRFVPRGTQDTSKFLIGQPSDHALDVGTAVYKGAEVSVDIFSGTSVISPGQATGRTAVIDRLLSPLTAEEVGTIRCIGLNYKQHAKEVNLDLPSEPTVFFKPSAALAGPWPEPTPLPRLTQESDSGDWESELCIVIGPRAVKDIPEDKALDYVLGYTAANDVSCRAKQFSQSQWCFSKGFDGSCPIGPTIVSANTITDPSKLHVRGLKNGEVMQDCGTDDLIFNVAQMVSFLSQGTTLPAGTIIITGTPAGVGLSTQPPGRIRAGDEFAVEILPHIGTLYNRFVNQEKL